MNYYPPLLRIIQQVENNAVDVVRTVLTGCVVGPAYQVIKYPEDKILGNLGVYNGSALSEELPNIIAGAKISVEDVNIFIENPKVILFKETSAVTYVPGLATGSSLEMLDSSLEFDNEENPEYIATVGKNTKVIFQDVKFKADKLIQFTADDTEILFEDTTGIVQNQDIFISHGSNAYEGKVVSVDAGVVTINPAISFTVDTVNYADVITVDPVKVDKGYLVSRIDNILNISNPITTSIATSSVKKQSVDLTLTGVDQEGSITGKVYVGDSFKFEMATLGDKITVNKSGSLAYSGFIGTIDANNKYILIVDSEGVDIDTSLLVENDVIEVIHNTPDTILNPSIEVSYIADNQVITLNSDQFTVNPDNNMVTIDSGIAIEFPSDIVGEKQVSEANAFIAYKALRTDLQFPVEITGASGSSIADVLNDTSEDNPLGLGAKMFSGTNGGAAFFVLGIPSDDLDGYIQAAENLKFVRDIYALAILSDDPAVAGVFKSHSDFMNSPEIAVGRMSVSGMKLITESILYDPRTEADENVSELQTVVITDTDGVNNIVSIDGAEFLSDGVRAADRFIATTVDGDTIKETTHIVDTVISETVIKVTTATAFDATRKSEIEAIDCKVNIKRTLTKTEQALVNGAQGAFGNQRVIKVWPPVIEVEGKYIPGYYASAVVAAAIVSTPPQVGITFYSLPLITSVKYSADYFTYEQLNTLAGQGVCVIQQDTPTQIPYIRHQLTTDMTATDYREISHVKNRDYIVAIIKAAVAPLVGRGNIVPETLNRISAAADLQLTLLKQQVIPFYGPVCTAGSVGAASAIEGTKDSVQLTISGLGIPNVFNNLDVVINFSG
jgi:hypothetical protein